MKISASKLRENIYNILDQALETGLAVEVKRKGRVLKIVPPPKVSRLAKLKKRKYLVGDPETIVHIDWLKESSELK